LFFLTYALQNRLKSESRLPNQCHNLFDHFRR
jgi:hypothetical protein